jgi:cell division protein FtsL
MAGVGTEENPGLRRAADKATRAACDMRTVIRRHKLERWLTVETRSWIAKHDAADAKRIAKENAAGIRQRVKQRALDKLTLEERRVLGL